MTTHPNLTIAIVDDDQTSSAYLTLILQEWGFSVASFESVSALRQARLKQTFLAVILDLAMPEMDGFEFLHSLSENDHMEPIVIWSGMPSPVIFAAKSIGTSKGVQVIGAFAKSLKKGDLENLKRTLDQLGESHIPTQAAA